MSEETNKYRGDYSGALLPAQASLADVRAVAADYRAMLLTIMEAIADRYEPHPEYRFIDTKLSAITGKDFSDQDPVRGRNAIYGWIQGRGLEAVAGHCRWLRSLGIGADLRCRLERMLPEVLENLRRIRMRNRGHLFFLMTADGQPFRLDKRGRPETFELPADFPYGFSDLFTAKGMYAAARYLHDPEMESEALEYCRAVDQAIWDGSFQSDQQTLDSKNPVVPRPGRHPHGPFMIQVGTAALLAEQGRPEAVAMGLRLIRHELAFYVNLDGRIPELREHDMWEAIGNDGLPYREDGAVLSDPGHALEFVGLTLKFAAAVRAQGLADGDQAAEIAAIEERMPGLLERNFTNGFCRKPGGITKAFDLISRKHLNTDLPWWNLPETMRSAAYCWRVTKDDADRQMCLNILADCHNAFTRFVRPGVHLMAVQTRAATGEAVDVIPASADADPGYHTGLSIIDMLEITGAPDSLRHSR